MGIFPRLQQPWESESPSPSRNYWCKICCWAFLWFSDTPVNFNHSQVHILTMLLGFFTDPASHTFYTLLNSSTVWAICYSWCMICKLACGLSIFHKFALTWPPPGASQAMVAHFFTFISRSDHVKHVGWFALATCLKWCYLIHLRFSPVCVHPAPFSTQTVPA